MLALMVRGLMILVLASVLLATRTSAQRRQQQSNNNNNKNKNNNTTIQCLSCQTDADCIPSIDTYNSISTTPGICLNQQCTDAFDDLLGVGCSCRSDADCTSGRCEGLPIFSMCKETLPLGSYCSENSDCASDRCSIWFVCSTVLGEDPFTRAPEIKTTTTTTAETNGEQTDEPSIFAMLGSIIVVSAIIAGIVACCRSDSCGKGSKCCECCTAFFQCCGLCAVTGLSLPVA